LEFIFFNKNLSKYNRLDLFRLHFLLARILPNHIPSR
jgi:hypothetical protein